MRPRDHQRPTRRDPADPEWQALLDQAPPEVRQELERLQADVKELEAEIDRLWAERFPSGSRGDPDPRPAPPEAELKALCRRFGITAIKTLGRGTESHPENADFLVFVKLGPGIDQDSVDLWELESRLGDLFRRGVTVRFL